MAIKYRALNPNGGFIESLDKEELPEDWTVIELEIENNNQEMAICEIENLRMLTRTQINDLLYEHTRSLLTRGIEIPEEIKSEYNKIRLDYSNLKNEILIKYNLL